MSLQHHVARTLGVLIAAALCLVLTGCPFTEPIADDAGTSGSGGSSGGSGTTSTGGVSGFVGDTGGGPVTGIEDGSSGITGRQ